MVLTCLIIDDEPLAVKLLESYVEKTPSLKLVGSYNSAVAALDYITTSSVDLIFCDIQMPDLNGLQFAQIMSHSRSRIVFTTAFDQYALEGWEVNALHYLLKPIDYPSFIKAVNKALKWFEMLDTIEKSPTAMGLPHESVIGESNESVGEANVPQTITGDSIFVKSDYKLVRIRFDQILYIEGLKDYVKIYLEGERKAILSLTSMRAIEAVVPAGKFLRTHRSFIVNMDQVNVLERGQIVFGEKHIPISDSYKDIVQNYFSTRTLQGRS